MWSDHSSHFLDPIITILRVIGAKAIMFVPTFSEANHLTLLNLPAPRLECSPQLLGMAAGCGHKETLVSRRREKNDSSRPEKGVG